MNWLKELAGLKDHPGGKYETARAKGIKLLTIMQISIGIITGAYMLYSTCKSNNQSNGFSGNRNTRK